MDIDQPSSERIHPLGGGASLHGETAGDTTGCQRSPAEEPSDEQLFKTFCDTEDTGAYEVLVSRYERELFSYLRRYVGSAEMAEDVFQATFLQIYVKRDRFEVGRRFRPWLYTVATNQAIDAQRRNRRHRMVSLDQRAGNDEEGDLMSVV